MPTPTATTVRDGDELAAGTDPLVHDNFVDTAAHTGDTAPHSGDSALRFGDSGTHTGDSFGGETGP